MPTLYLIEQNTYLRKRGDRLLLCRRPQTISKRSRPARVDEIILDLPCADVDHVMLFGNIQVTTQAMQQLLTHGIELAIFSYSGRLLGQLTPPKTKNIPLRISQFEKFKDDAFKLEFARRIVLNKIKTEVDRISRYRANYPKDISGLEQEKLSQISEQVRKTDSLEQLLGFEGSAATAYFRLLGRMFKPPWRFEKRTRRPPKDPVNAVLSFGYVVVGAELQALLDGVGFDPYLGFFHSIEYGRPGLALDLLEEFRHTLVDRLVLKLFNLSILKQEDFVDRPKGGIYLNSEGKRKFFAQYEKLLGKPAIDDDEADTRQGFRAIFQQQVSALMKTILEDEPYIPYGMI